MRVEQPWVCLVDFKSITYLLKNLNHLTGDNEGLRDVLLSKYMGRLERIQAHYFPVMFFYLVKEIIHEIRALHPYHCTFLPG